MRDANYKTETRPARSTHCVRCDAHTLRTVVMIMIILFYALVPCFALRLYTHTHTVIITASGSLSRSLTHALMPSHIFLPSLAIIFKWPTIQQEQIVILDRKYAPLTLMEKNT
jgi:hypothetical protein